MFSKKKIALWENVKSQQQDRHFIGKKMTE